jgi:tRNA A37 N6-isopentenylltransferase MiaA
MKWLEVESANETRHGLKPHEASAYTALGALAQSIQTRTRQFAKRQHTWFRNLEESRPISVGGDESPEEIADLVLRASESLSKVSIDGA